MTGNSKAHSTDGDEPAERGDHQPSRLHRTLPLTISREELLLDGSDRRFRRLVHALFGFLARHERIRAGHANVIGLAGIEYTVLISIAHLSYDRDVNIKAVADHLHLSGAFITSVVRRLLGKGFVHKRTSDQDRRRVSLTISDEGHDLLEQLAPVQRQVNDVEFACLTREEAEWLLDIMERLIDCGDQAVALQRYLKSKRRNE